VLKLRKDRLESQIFLREGMHFNEKWRTNVHGLGKLVGRKKGRLAKPRKGWGEGVGCEKHYSGGEERTAEF